MSRPHLVICGGGYAGVMLAYLLARRRLADRFEITLVGLHPHQVCLTQLPEVISGRVTADHISLPYRDLFRRTSVQIVEGIADGVDFAAGEVSLRGTASLRYDYLVIAMGSQPALPPIPGLETFGLMLWSREDAERLGVHVERMFRQATGAADPMPWISVVVGGGGFTGVEIAGELMERARALARSLGLRLTPTVSIVHGGPHLLPGFDPVLVAAAERRLQVEGVRVLTQSRIAAVESDKVILDNGSGLGARTFVWTGGVRVNERLSRWGLTTGVGGRAVVTPYLESVDHPNVFVIGDDSLIVEPDGRPVPTTAQLAVEQAATLATVLEGRLETGIRPQPYRPRPVGVAVSVGPHYAVARLGPLRLRGRPAQWMKRLAYWRYLWGLRAWSRILGDARRRRAA